VQDIDDRPGAAGNKVGRLEDDGVAVAERRCNLPGRNGNREVPGRDDADDAERFAGDFNADVRASGWNDFACQAQCFAGKEIENLGGADGLADAFGQNLAFFAGEKRTKLFLAREDLIGGLLQDGVTLENAGARPGRESGLGSGNRLLGVFGGSLCVKADDFVGVRRVDVLRRFGSDPFAADKVVVNCQWCTPCNSFNFQCSGSVGRSPAPSRCPPRQSARRGRR